MTKEEFVSKRLEWLESRKAELIAEAQTADAEGIEARNAELEGIQAEIEEIRALKETENPLNENIEERDFNPLGTYGSAKKEEVRKMARFDINSAEYRDAWLRRLMGKEITAEERTAITMAQAVTPTETLNRIYGKLEENRLYAEIAPTQFNGYLRVPYAQTVNDSSWVAMSTASTDSADVVNSIVLGAYKLIKTVEVEADMEYMSIPAFESWLVAQITAKMLRAICASAIKGAGATEPTGVLTAVSPVATTITYKDILALMAGVDGAYHDGAVFVCSAATYFNRIMGLATNVGQPLTYQGVEGIEQEPAYWLLGHRVILDNNCDSGNDASLIFGNFRDGYAANWAKPISIESDDSVEFRKGSRVYRGLGLYDGNVVDKSAFAVAKVTSA